MPQLGRDLCQRLQHKASSCHSGMRNGQLRRIHDIVSEQQDVDVDRARAVADAVRISPELPLEGLDDIEQLQRLEAGAHPQAGIEERRLVCDLADGLGVIERGAREHLDARAGERVDGRLQLRAPLAHVRAEPEQTGAHAHRGRARGPTRRPRARPRWTPPRR